MSNWNLLNTKNKAGRMTMAETLFETKMHFARLDRSPRLQRVLKILKDGNKHTTLDLIQEASVCAVNSIVSELRMNGHDITCKRKGDVWEYRLK